MKKYSKIAYIISIVILVVLSFLIYKMIGTENKEEDQKIKTLSEMKYLEGKFVDLFNQMNNISFENYKIVSTEIKEKESKSSSQSSGKSKQGSGSSQGSEGSEGEESGESSSESEQSEENKKYELQSTGILTGDTEVNWNVIKGDVEKVYTSLYPSTLDLYQIEANPEDIINFNKEYDNLTKAVKDENKEDTLQELMLLYDYLPSFFESCTVEQKEKIIVATKNYIFKAYSVLDKEEWDTISENIYKAKEEFTKLVTDIKPKENKSEYNINKIYIIINELNNAVELKDKEVFLIKYRNILEEIQKI